MRYAVALLAVTSLALLVMAAGEDGAKPSDIALSYGHQAGLYSDAQFTLSDDAAVMVLAVTHGERSMRLYGDGRLEIQVSEGESYTRRVDRPRMLALFRSAVDQGLAEYDPDVIIHEMQGKPRDGRSLGGPPCPEGSQRITVTLRFLSYDRNGAYGGGANRAGFCAPEVYSHIPQARAFADLAAVLAQEVTTAQREGSVQIYSGPPYSEASFILSSDPGQLVLSLWRPVTYEHSLTARLYGDGRLEMEHKERGREPVIYERSLSFPEMVALIRIAVDHGFAEWDSEALRTVLGIGRAAKDAARAGGEIYLAKYQRGEYQRSDLGREFRFNDVGMAQQYSSHVTQVQGLLELRKALDEYFELARGERQQ